MKQKLLFAVCLCALCGGWYWAGQVQAASDRRADKPVPVTQGELPADFDAISWAAVPVPVDGADAVALASPLRTEMAGDILANLLSDPSWRAEIELWYRHYVSIGHKQAEASAMSKVLAADIALAFADALLEAAGG